MVGHGEDELPDARPRHRASTATACRTCLGAINIVLASGRIGREGCGYATITGQGNGQGGREHGQKCDQLPGGRDIENPEHRAHVAEVWGIDARGAAARRRRRLRDLPQDRPRRDQGPAVDLLQSRRSRCRTTTFIRRMLEKLEFYVAIDFFLNETARHADVVLPGSLHEEDEGRRHDHRRARHQDQQGDRPPRARRARTGGSSRTSRALGRPHGFTFDRPARDLRGAARRLEGRHRRLLGHHLREDRAAIRRLLALPRRRTIPARRGCSSRARGTRSPRAGPFYFPDGKARFNVAQYAPPTEDVDAEYPLMLTTGRVVSHFLSGTQTRRIGPLVDQYPEPRIEMHPQLAAKLGIADGDWATAESRRGTARLRAQVVTTIRPDTIFIPYHWAGAKSINQLTIAAQDPISKIPEYKVCAVRVRRRPRHPSTPAVGAAAVGLVEDARARSDMEFFIDPSRCIGCQACVQACSECDTHKGHSMIQLEIRRPRALDADGPGGLHALRFADLRRGLPGRRDQADRRRRRADRPQAALHRLQQLRAGLPVRRAQDEHGHGPDDEVRHVLRPHLGRQEADVRVGLPEPGAVLRHARGDRAHARPRSQPINTFQFGGRRSPRR